MAGCGDELILKSPVMGRKWVKQIGEQLVADLKPHQLVPSIFQVPAFFRSWDPKYYTPQLVDLGPFHHLRPQLWQTDAVKRRFLEQSQRRRRFNFPAGGNIDDALRNFTDLVVAPLIPAIRAQYNSHLDVLDSTLASSLALDSLFLVELLFRGSCDDDDGAAYCATILMNDAVMLENQIPLFLLQEPISALVQGRQSDGPFYEQLGRVYHQLSPLHLLGSPNHNHPRHLLEYLYFQIVGGGDGVRDQDQDSSTTTTTTTSFLYILEMAPPGLLKNVPNTAIKFDTFDLFSDTLKAVGAKLIMRAGFWPASTLMEAFRHFRATLLLEEASVPAASLLTRHLDLKILSAGEGSSLGAKVSFDEQKRTLHLPVLTLKPNCGTLLRNLVAYEYMTRTEDARVLIAYLKLIAGLTRTVADMSLLRRAHVVDVEGSDQSALELFSSQMPPVSLIMQVLDDQLKAQQRAKMKAGEELETVIKEVEALTIERRTKLEVMAAAKEAAASTAVDPQIQALIYCYNRKPQAISHNRERRCWEFVIKFTALFLLVAVATGCGKVIADILGKYVTLDCLYHWPCCPQGLFWALFTLVTGGFILNLIRSLL